MTSRPAGTAGCGAVVRSRFLPESAELLVKPEVARRQLDAETTPPAPTPGPAPGGVRKNSLARCQTSRSRRPRPPQKKARRYHGTVTLDTTRVGRDAGRIAEEVVAHLSGLVGAQVTVTLEIDAEIPEGAPGSRGAHGHREQPNPEVRQP